MCFLGALVLHKGSAVRRWSWPASPRTVGHRVVQAWQSRHKKAVQDSAEALSDVERLLYLTLRHLADVESRSLDSGDSRQLCIALYSDALAMDDSDPLTWLRLASAAHCVSTAAVAMNALKQGLSLHPNHILLLNKSLEVAMQV